MSGGAAALLPVARPMASMRSGAARPTRTHHHRGTWSAWLILSLVVLPVLAAGCMAPTDPFDPDDQDATRDAGDGAAEHEGAGADIGNGGDQDATAGGRLLPTRAPADPAHASSWPLPMDGLVRASPRPYADPDVRQLVVLGIANGTAWNATDASPAPPAVKLLHDGAAFIALFEAPAPLSVPDPDTSADDGAGDTYVGIHVFVARVVDESGEAWAWGTAAANDTGRTVVPLTAARPRPPGEHRLEAWQVRPVGVQPATTADETANETDLSAGPAVEGATLARDLLLGAVAEHAAAVDLLVDPVALWSLPLGFRSQGSVALTGPGEGIDRPDLVEGAGVLTVQTGTYTIVVEGRRIWGASLLVELDQSRVHDSAPALHVNGSRAFEVSFSGPRPLDHWLFAPWTDGQQQTFRLEVEVDWETDEDALEPHTATYFATLQHGYRQDGTTFVGGTAGSQVFVDVRPDDAGTT